MKAAVIFLCFGVIGLLVGNRGDRDSRSEEEKDSDPLAITFQGDGPKQSADDFFQSLSEVPPGGKYSRTRLLEWMTGEDGRLRYAAIQEWLRTDENGEGIRMLYEAGYTTEAWHAISVWGKTNPVKAARLAFEWPPGSRDENAIFEGIVNRSINQLLDAGSESAVKIADRYSPRSGSSSFSTVQFESEKWSAEKVNDTLALVEQFSSSWQRFSYAESLLKKLGETDPGAALNWCEKNLSVSHRISMRDDILESVLKKDSAKAVELVESMKDPHDRKQWTDLLLWKMGKAADKGPIKEWLREQDPGELGSSPFSPFVAGSPKVFGAESSREETSNQEPRKALFTDWPITTSDEARGWISGFSAYNRNALPDENAYEQVQAALQLLRKSSEEIPPKSARELVKAFAKSDPEKAMQFASELPEHLTIEAADTALTAWFNTSPVDAREYVEAIPDSEFRRYAVERMTKNWLLKDPEPAIKWVNRMPRGIDKDIGRREIATTYQNRNPQRAFAQANAIDNAVIRDEMLESVFQTWFRKNPDKASTFLEQANLPDNRKQDFRPK